MNANNLSTEPQWTLCQIHTSGEIIAENSSTKDVHILTKLDEETGDRFEYASDGTLLPFTKERQSMCRLSNLTPVPRPVVVRFLKDAFLLDTEDASWSCTEDTLRVISLAMEVGHECRSLLSWIYVQPDWMSDETIQSTQEELDEAIEWLNTEMSAERAAALDTDFPARLLMPGIHTADALLNSLTNGYRDAFRALMDDMSVRYQCREDVRKGLETQKSFDPKDIQRMDQAMEKEEEIAFIIEMMDKARFFETSHCNP